MKAFVTGAAGPLGRVLTAALVRRGDVVLGLVRRRTGITVMRQLGAQPVVGDLSSADALTQAMHGCDVVFHLAQFFDFWAEHESVFQAVNIAGTKHALSAAITARVPRFVLCSSAMTIGETPGQRGHEFTRHRGYTVTAFERSQLAAERFALEHGRNEIEVVVVNPALIVAPSDPGWTGRLIARCVARGQAFASDRPVGWVSVNDAARGLVLAAEKGDTGERYILSGDTLSTQQMMAMVARQSGHAPPRSLPAAISLGGAKLATAVAARWGRRPWVSADEARFAATGCQVNGMRAVDALGVTYTPIAKYLPSVVRSYRSALARFAD